MSKTIPHPPLTAVSKYGRLYPDKRAAALNGELARRLDVVAREYIQSCTDDELYLMGGGLGQLTEANCWWWLYDLRFALGSMILHEQHFRSKNGPRRLDETE